MGLSDTVTVINSIPTPLQIKPTQKFSQAPSTPFDTQIEQAFAFQNDLKLSELSDKSLRAVVEGDGKKDCIEFYLKTQKG